MSLAAVTRYRDWVTHSLKNRGVRNTCVGLARLPGSAVFDLRRGVRTSGRQLLGAQTLTMANASSANPYKGIHPRGFRLAMKRFAIAPSGAFVDYGAGKGRALILAIEYGFTSVIGIEFDEELCRQGQRNLEDYQRRRPGQYTAEMLCSDAANYAVKPEDSVFFIYNSFGIPVLREVLSQIAQSVRDHPRKVQVIYANPKHDIGSLDDRFRLAMTHEDVNVGKLNLYEFDLVRSGVKG